ncbi:hypothetical protein HDV01_000646 [Terramyces sp. JEL0728]|nr:hypothetical protein HDV01_000646 [Terramyces sp. JEL0728]
MPLEEITLAELGDEEPLCFSDEDYPDSDHFDNDFDDDDLDEQLRLYQQQILLIYQTNQQLKEALAVAEQTAGQHKVKAQELQSTINSLKASLPA